MDWRAQQRDESGGMHYKGVSLPWKWEYKKNVVIVNVNFFGLIIEMYGWHGLEDKVIVIEQNQDNRELIWGYGGYDL